MTNTLAKIGRVNIKDKPPLRREGGPEGGETPSLPSPSEWGRGPRGAPLEDYLRVNFRKSHPQGSGHRGREGRQGPELSNWLDKVLPYLSGAVQLAVLVVPPKVSVTGVVCTTAWYVGSRLRPVVTAVCCGGLSRAIFARTFFQGGLHLYPAHPTMRGGYDGGGEGASSICRT